MMKIISFTTLNSVLIRIKLKSIFFMIRRNKAMAGHSVLPFGLVNCLGLAGGERCRRKLYCDNFGCQH